MKPDSCNCGLLSCKEVNAKDKDNKFTLKPLPYAENALAPYISEQTVRYHYGKHLAAYIDNTNKLKAGTELDDRMIHEIVRKSSGSLFNNAAQVFNHYFYFEALHASTQEMPQGKLLELINKNFGNFEDFKEKFAQAGTSLFGSGWVWLIKESEKLEIIPASNADNPLKCDKYPLLTMDVWEHAYYLDTQNARAKYIENFWNVVNWKIVEQRIK
ncbi:MAG: superoxide dismutase [Odoribacter sp.]